MGDEAKAHRDDERAGRPATADPRAQRDARRQRLRRLTASLNSTSRHLLGDAEFRALKPGAGIVNVARGGLVDQEALLAALADGRVRGAVLDVVVPQPLPPEHPLWAHPRVIVTSHISGGSPEGWARSMELFRRNLPLYLDGDLDRLGNVVDLADHL